MPPIIPKTILMHNIIFICLFMQHDTSKVHKIHATLASVAAADEEPVDSGTVSTSLAFMIGAWSSCRSEASANDPVCCSTVGGREAEGASIPACTRLVTIRNQQKLQQLMICWHDLSPSLKPRSPAF